MVICPWEEVIILDKQYIFPPKDTFTVSFNQVAHDLAILKTKMKIDNNKVETLGDLFELYVNELDTMKCYLKGIYGDDIFTK